MATNIEIKAKAKDFPKQMALAKQYADGPGTLIQQEDLFFNTGQGRLKLRIFEEGHGELIGYQRPDSKQPGPSNYFRCPIAAPPLAQKALAMTCGIRGIVRKRRTLFLVGKTRIHFDEVEGLGQFIELEVVLDHNLDEAQGRHIAEALMLRLGIGTEDLISQAYIDLLVEIPSGE